MSGSLTQYRSRREGLQAGDGICKIWKCESPRHSGGRRGKCWLCLNEREPSRERDVPEKLKCLRSLLDGWVLSCKRRKVSGDGQAHRSVVGLLLRYSASQGVGHTGSNGLTWEQDKNPDSESEFRISGRGALEFVLYQDIRLILIHIQIWDAES